MKQATLTIMGKTADKTAARFEIEGKGIVGERDIAFHDVESLVAGVEDKIAAKGAPASPLLIAKAGGMLADWLDDPNERWLAGAIENNVEGLTLHVHVQGFSGEHAKIAERLRRLPWEILHFNGAFLCARQATPFTPVRLVEMARMEHSTANRPLRVLLMACSPEDVKPLLDFEKEEWMIIEATSRQPIELTVEESGTLRGLEQRIEDYGRGYFDVFHLTGHANVVNGRPMFVMEDDFGRHVLADAERLARAFSNIWPRLIFLSGCKTGEAPKSGVLPSFCEALVSAGAPAALGWVLPVHDNAASAAAAELYHHLAAGRRIDEAVAFSRRKLFEDGHSDWPLLWFFSNATPLDALVTPLRTKGRAALEVRETRKEFLGAGSKTEVCLRKDFVGRRRIIQRCLRVLCSRQTDPEYAQGVLLHCMGGLGKSSLASRLCERMNTHQRLVWVGFLDEKGLIKVLAGHLEDMESIELLSKEGLPLTTKLRRCLDMPFSEKPVLFILDDFEANVGFNSAGEPVVRREALEILGALAAAINQSASSSRIIVTCRYGFDLPHPLRLHKEMLYSMLGPELEKKTGRLDGFRKLRESADEDKKELFALAVSAAAGNPRMLDRIDKILLDPRLDHSAILSAVAETEGKFREDVILKELLGRLTPQGRRLLAVIAVFDLPVPLAAIKAATDKDALGELGRVAALGLAELIHSDAEGIAYIFVSRIVAPLVEKEIDDAQKAEAQRAGAQALYKYWYVDSPTHDIIYISEIHRLALLSAEKEIAAEMAFILSSYLINRNLYREALALCGMTLTLGEDHLLLHNLARAEKVLGKTGAARIYFERALELCPIPEESTPPQIKKEYGAIMTNLADLLAQTGEVNRAMVLWDESLKLLEQIGDVKGKSATLNNMAGVIADQGDVSRAMGLWVESLKLSEQIGDVKGNSATLDNMASVIAAQGDVLRAMVLWDESLKLSEQVGDVKGKATTLNKMAIVIADQGDVSRAMILWEESLKLSEQIGNVKGKAATLGNMTRIIAAQGDVSRAMGVWDESLKLYEKVGDVQGKAATLGDMAGVIADQGDVSRAMGLWVESLELFEQVGDVQGKAVTLSNMANVIATQGDVSRAMGLWDESLKLYEQVGDVQDKATTLNNMAGVIAARGDISRAMVIWEESLKLKEQIGDVRGKAATLSNMAGVIADQGDVSRAMGLWEESLKLKEQIGDLQGKAATLANIAYWENKRGNTIRGRELNIEAARLLGSVRAFVDLFTVLGNLGGGDDPDALKFLAQAMWLCLRISIPLGNIVNTAAAFIEKIGLEAEASPWAATTAVFLVRQQGEKHPQHEEMKRLSIPLLAGCAEARGIPDEKFLDWVVEQKLNDPGHFLPALNGALEAMVGEDGWVFDRSVLMPSKP